MGSFTPKLSLISSLSRALESQLAWGKSKKLFNPTQRKDGRRRQRDGPQKDGGARAPRAAVAIQEEEGLHDSGEEEETEAAAEKEGRRGAQEGTGAQVGREEKGHRREVRQA